MLQNIRTWAEGWLAWIIVILIAVPFALWGINEYFTGGGELTVAEVNDRDISQQELEQAYQRQRQRLQAMLGDQLDERLLKRQVLEGMVNQLLLVQAVDEAGLQYSDAQLANQIRFFPTFQRDGQFDKALYEQRLGTQGLSPREFEAQLHEGALLEQYEAGITATALVTPEELKQFVRLKEQQRDISYLIVPAARFMPTAVIAEQDIVHYFKEHESEFVEPERVSIEYLELKLDELAEAIEPPSEEALQKLYQERQGDFTVEEQRRASHILVAVDPNADERAMAEARSKAQALKDRVQKGEAFEAVAQEASQDPGSAKQGGDLGYFGRGIMDKAFEDAVFSMTPGELRLVQTPFGFHVIKLTDIKPAQTKPFAEVRDQLAHEDRRHRAERIFLDKGERLADLAYEHPDSLEPAAKELGLSIKTSGLFSRDGAGGQDITANPKVVQAAFAQDVLGEGHNSEPIEVSADHLLVLRIREHKPSAPKPLHEVRAQIEQKLRMEAAREEARKLGEQIAEQLRQGKNPLELASQHQLQWEAANDIKRDERKLHLEIVRTAFGLSRPEANKSSLGSAVFPSGDYVLVRVLAVKDGKTDGIDGTERQGLRRELAENYGEGEFNGVAKALRAQGDVELYPERL
jgi:peptidyl-prolyl cis-trans isomerase D